MTRRVSAASYRALRRPPEEGRTPLPVRSAPMGSRVLVSDDLSADGIQILRKAGLEVEVRTALPPDELERIIPAYDALGVRSATKVTARLLEKATRLKVVGRAGVGVDNVDVEAATRRGVVVMNTPGGSSTTVAELTLALMLALARHVPQDTASVKAGRWEKKRFQGREADVRSVEHTSVLQSR